MRNASAIKMHFWSPEITRFGGGIGLLSRELADVLRASEGVVLARLIARADGNGQYGGLPVSGAGAWPESWRTPIFAMLAAVHALRARPGVVIATHLHFGPLAFWLRRLQGTRYVLLAHGAEISPALSPLRLNALRQADMILAVSRWAERRLLELGVDQRRVSLLPNTFREELFSPGLPEPVLRARYGIQPGERTILTVGRLAANEHYKGHDRVIAALPQIQQRVGPVRYLIVGDGDDANRIAALAERLGTRHRVVLCGHVPDSELAAHYRLADVFAMPSTGEGFGIAYLEALACGIPVLAGSSDGARDALADGELGLLVDPLDIAAIGAGLIQLLQRRGPPQWFDPDSLRQTVVQRFGRRAFARRVGTILSGLLRSQG